VEVVHGSYALIEAFKGDPAAHGVVTDRIDQPGSCALGLSIGREYLFHVDLYGEVLRCGGSVVYDAASDPHGRQLERFRAFARSGR
jgi:hypothetical protein